MMYQTRQITKFGVLVQIFWRILKISRKKIKMKFVTPMFYVAYYEGNPAYTNLALII